MNRSIRRASCLGVLSLAVACGGEETPIDTPNRAQVRAIHLAPEAGDVDVILANEDRTITFENIDFKNGSAYRSVIQGTYRIDVVPEGEDRSQALMTARDVVFDQATNYTLAAYGEGAARSLDVLIDEYDIPDNEIRIRMLNVEVETEGLTIGYLTDDGVERTLDRNVSFGELSDVDTIGDGDTTFLIDLQNDGTFDLEYDGGDLGENTLANLFPVIGDDDLLELVLQRNDGSTTGIDPQPYRP